MRLLLKVLTLVLVPATAFPQCTGSWVRQISALPNGNLANSNPRLVVDATGNVIVSNVITNAQSVVTDGQEFPETNSLPPNDDFFIAKYNSEGVLLWFKTIIGEHSCGPLDMVSDEFGSIYVGGIMQNSIDIDGLLIQRPSESLPQPGFFIVKFSPSGELLWHHKGDWRGSRCYSLSWTGEHLAYVIPYSDSILVSDQIFYSDGGFQDMVFGRMDTDGNLLSAVNIGGAGNIDIRSLSCSSQGCLLQGKFDYELSVGGVNINTPSSDHSEAYQLYINSDNSLGWLQKSSSVASIDPKPYGLGLMADGSAFFSGDYWNSSFSLDGHQLPAPQQNDVFIGKLNTVDGEVAWMNRANGSSFDLSRNLFAHQSGAWVGVDFYSSELSYDGQNIPNSNASGADGAVLSISEEGRLRCWMMLSGIGDNQVHSLSGFESGHIAILSSFNQMAEVMGQTFTANGNYDLLVIKTCLPCDTLTGIPDINRDPALLHLYPNPATHTVRFEVSRSKFHVQSLAITDMLGHTVMNLKPETLNSELDISCLANGVYTVAAQGRDGEVLRARLVVGR